MALHSIQTGGNLHVPLGTYDTVNGAANPLVLPAQGSAYIVQFDTGNVAFQVNCVSGTVHIGNDTDSSDINLNFGTTGELQISGAPGTTGQTLVSQGANLAPVWSSGGGGGAVDSVNGAVGVVVLDSDDVAEGAANFYATGSVGTHSDVDLTSIAANDLLYYDGADFVRLAQGTNGYILTSNAGVPTWTLGSGGDVNSVNGEIGTVVLDTSDFAEVTNLWYTDARVAATTEVTANTAKVSAGGSINTHSDVDTTTAAPTDAQVLTWVNANGAWEPASATAGVIEFDDLTDVEITTPAAGSVLVHNGATWLDLDAGTTGQYLEGGTTPAWTTPVGSGLVDSVNGEVGTVVLDTSDFAEVTNLFYTEPRVDARIALTEIDDLANVTITTPDTGAVLYYNGTAWIDLAVGIGGEYLEGGAAPSWSVPTGSGNVDSVNTQTGIVVLDSDDIAEGATNLYATNTRSDARIAAASIGDLSDVTITTPDTGAVLYWDSAAWVDLGVGTSGQYLEAGSLPAWTTPAGTAGDMLASVYDAAGHAAQVVTEVDTQTLTNKTLTSPAVGGTIDGTAAALTLDVSAGADSFVVSSTSGAYEYLNINGTGTDEAITIGGTGDPVINIGAAATTLRINASTMNLSNNTKTFSLRNNESAALAMGSLVTYDTTTAANKVDFNAAANFLDEVQLTGAAGTSGQVLTSAGTGAACTWETPSAGGGIPLTFTTNTASASLAEDATTGDEFIAVTTTTGSQTLSLGNATVDTDIDILGAGNLSLVGGTRFKIGVLGVINIGNLAASLAYSGTRSTAIGGGASGANSYDVAIGYDATATGSESVAIGYNSSCLSFGTSVGSNAECLSNGGVAIGTSAKCGSAAGNNVAIGYGAANGNGNANSICISGRNSSNDADNQFVLGSGSSPITDCVIGGNDSANAAPSTNVVWRTTNGVGTNITSSTLDIAPGAGTGTGLGGSVTIQTPQVLTTGTTVQTLYDRIVVDQGSVEGSIALNTVTNDSAKEYVQTGYVETDGAGSTGTLIDIALPADGNFAVCKVVLEVLATSDDADAERYMATWNIWAYYTGGTAWTVGDDGGTVHNFEGTGWDIIPVESGGTLRISGYDSDDITAGTANVHWTATAHIKKLEAV